MAFLEWCSDFVTGIELVDQQHQALFEIGNALALALVREDDEDARKQMEEFLGHLEIHFRTEEALMEDAGYPGLEAHRAEHDAVWNRLEKTLVSPEGMRLPSFVEMEGMRNWLLAHLRNADRKMSEYFRVSIAGRAA